MNSSLKTTSTSLVLVVAVFFGPAQAADTIESECGVQLSAEQQQVAAELFARGFYDLPQVPGIEQFVPRVPVTIHVVRTTGGNGGISGSTALAHFVEAISYWQSMGIELYQAGPVRVINDTGLYEIDNELELALLWSTDVVPDTVNVYFVNRVAVSGDDVCGVGTFSAFGPLQGVVVANDCTTVSNNSTLAHEIGHFFDLLHTHETFFGVECPDGSNCGSTGDLVCDTPADPNLGDATTMDSNACLYLDNAIGCAGQPYAPDTQNIMSYANPRTCRTRFSSGQRDRALATLMNIRPNLIESGQPNVIWVDFDADSLFPNGDFTNPYLSFGAGLSATPPGGRLVIKAGTTPEQGTFTNPATIDAFNGIAVIGE